MKNLKNYLIIAMLSLPCFVLAEENNFADLVKSFQNPLEGKTFLLSNSRIFSEEVATSIRKDHPEQELPNPLKFDSLFSYKNGNIHQRGVIKHEDGRDNIMDLFLKNGTIYRTDSLSPNTINIFDRDFFMDELHTYIELFNKAKNALSNESLEINKSKDSYILSWSEESKRHLLTLDSTTLFPSFYETRHENGDKIETYDISTKDSKIKITRTSFNIGNSIFARNDITISESDSVKLNPEFEEGNIGYKSAWDERGGILRKYVVFNKIPDKKFLDELFQNPDDVQRYNEEIHRLAHPNEFLGNGLIA